MVLQRDQAITLRGSATAGKPRLIGGPYTITLNGDAVAEDVLVGDVFLCTGQSNMEY